MTRSVFRKPSLKKSLSAKYKAPFKNLLSSMYQQVGHYEEVNVNHKQMKPLENHDDSPVNLGDKVELLSKSRE